ncbi:MAG: ABC transporter permease/substrate-binding protein [Lactobacillaceae bacterium]|nr:ABC transporter permease/substrate-binding protein [Lactobacillaceae bacterium]
MLKELIHILSTQRSDILAALEQHIFLSIVSLIIAAAIAIPLAIVLMNRRKAGEFVLQVAGIIQTLPSLAILGFLIPFVGIGTLPAIIALVMYAIMPIFQNTYSGLTEIDPSLNEAADAFGLTKGFKLFKVQLPLAMPMIMSGIRIAMVMIIGTATLAALIGGGGLGTFIMLGIQTNNNAELLLGAILSAALALIFSALIQVISELSLRKIGILLSVFIVLIAGGFGISSLSQPQGKIVIAGKLGGEPEILINMYKDLIEQDRPSLKVELKPNFGGTSFLYKALKSNQIDIYPEFTGTVLQTLVKTDSIPHNPKTAYIKARDLIKKQDNLIYLEPMKYQNTYAIAVTKQTATRYKLKTTSDLTKVSSLLTAGFDPDFYKLPDGYPGLQQAYGLNFKQVSMMESSLRYEAVKNNQVSATDAYTTDPQLKEYNLVSLQDDKLFFPPYQGAPLINPKILEKYPEIKESLEKLSNKITNTQMIEMNYQVTIKHQKASKVAREYLLEHQLLSK